MKHLMASGIGFLGLSGKTLSHRAPEPKTEGRKNSHCYRRQSSVFGRTIEIAALPSKICPFDCIYCSQGRTLNRSVDLTYITIQKNIIHEIKSLLSECPAPEYIVISGKGDPAVCAGMASFIGTVKSITGIPVVVISCGGLFWKSNVQKELLAADVVVASLDAPDKTLFQCINRPIGVVPFARFLSGMMEFRSSFKGEFILRMTLLDGINAIEAEVKKLAGLATRVSPSKIVIQTAHKTPVEDFAFPVERTRLECFAGFFKDVQTQVIEAHTL